MARHQQSPETTQKRRAKKEKARKSVSSSCESDRDIEHQSKQNRNGVPRDASPAPTPIAVNTDPTPTKSKKEKGKKITPPKSAQESVSHGLIDTEMQDAPSPAPAAPSASSSITTTQRRQHPPPTQTQIQEEFTAVYLQKITKELADDLDKVRSAQDFKVSSVPMLVHALKQGAQLFTAEEKARVVGTVI